jgi:WD40 repeat protein/tRNA A-37 threonylcarbamoyl transferase component Bud32/regulator of sirC expression with transglutaminase-like and TPR domain
MLEMKGSRLPILDLVRPLSAGTIHWAGIVAGEMSGSHSGSCLPPTLNSLPNLNRRNFQIGSVMTQPKDSVPLSFGERLELEKIIDAFESAWQAGERPDWNQFLPSDERLLEVARHELRKIEREYRSKTGEPLSEADFATNSESATSIACETTQPLRALTQATDASAGTVGINRAICKSRFKVIRPHAEGGLGLVSLASDEELHREVALKEIKPQYADHANCRARFLQEAEITGGLEHPGIVPVYGLGRYPDGRPYYAMRFIRGDSLKEAVETFHAAHLSNVDGIEFRKLLGRFIDVCQAIAYAHSRGVLHRDLKPGNIMLGEYGETLVVDWGLAKADGKVDQFDPSDELTLKPASGSDVDPTQEGTTLGTPAYMSPEQAQGRLDLLGPASDVFSLGATLYHLIVGRPPFHAKSGSEAHILAQRGSYPRPRQLRPNIPVALEAICLKAMALLPGDRYVSAAALAQDLESFLGDEPIAARQESWMEKLLRVARRHRAWVLASAAALVLTTVIAATAYFREASIAESNRQLATQKGRLAESNKKLAENNAQLVVQETSAKKEAISRSEELRLYLSRQYLQNGNQALRENDYALAWLWYVKALELDVGNAAREENHRLRIALTWRQMPRMIGLLRHDGVVNSFQPNAAWTHAITASDDHSARVWQLESGQLVGSKLIHLDKVNRAIFSPDESLVATASDDGTARVWNAQTGAPVTGPLKHGFCVLELAFNPAGTHLATACGRIFDYPAPENKDLPVAAVWEIATGKCTPLNTISRPRPQCIAFNANGTLVATGGVAANSTAVWDAATGELRFGPLEHAGRVTDVRFDGNGKHVLAQTPMQTLLFDMQGAQKTIHIPLVNSLAQTKVLDEDHVQIGDAIWNVELNRKVDEAPPRIQDRYFVAGAGETALRIFDRAGVDPGKPPRFHGGRVDVADYSSDGKYLATGNRDQHGIVARAFDAATGRQAMTPVMHGLNDQLNEDMAVAFSDDGSMLATGGPDRVVRTYQLPGFTPLYSIPEQRGAIKQLHFVLNSQTLIVCEGIDNWNIEYSGWRNGEMLWPHFKNGFRGYAFAMSPDGGAFATGNGGGTGGRAPGEFVVRLRDSQTGEPLLGEMKHAWSVSTPAFHPGGKLLASPAHDQTVRLWDLETGKQVGVIHTEDRSENRYTTCCFSRDGKYLIVGGNHGVQIWQIDPIQSVTRLNPMDLYPEGWIEVSPNGKWFLVGEQSNPTAPQAFTLPEMESLGPALAGIGPALRAILRSDGEEAAVIGPGGVQQFDFRPDSRSLQVLRSIAELHAGRNINNRDEVIALTAAELETRWQLIGSESPADRFCSQESIRSWKLRRMLNFSRQRLFRETQEQASEILTTFGDDPEVKRVRGLAAITLGDNHEAAADLCDYLGNGGGLPEIWELSAKALIQEMGWQRELDRAFTKLERDPKNPYLQQVVAFLRSGLRHDEAAAADFQRAVDLGARGPVFLQMANVEARLGRWKEAKQNIKRWLDYDRQSVEGQVKLAYLHLAAGKTEGADQPLQQIALHSARTKNLAVLSRFTWLEAASLKRDLGAARAMAQQAAKSEPANARYVANLALAQFRIGEHEIARQSLEHYLAGDPQTKPWQAWLILALVRNAQSAKDDAMANLAKAQEWRAAQPDHPTLEFDWEDRIEYSVLISELTAIFGSSATHQ